MLLKRKQVPLAVERKNAHDPELLMQHFRRFKAVCKEYGIVRCDLYNMDETGFRTGMGAAHWVVTMEKNKKKRLVLTDPNNCDYITSIECISVGDDGFSIPAFLIIAGAWIMEKWALENSLDDNTVLAATPLGYSDDELAMDWLKHFNQHMKKRQHDAYRILVIDGYGSHMTLEFLNYATEHNIILFCFPLHSTHLLQPLDIDVFQPFKHWHTEVVDEAMRYGQTEFTKLNFFHLFPRMHQQTFTPRTIS